MTASLQAADQIASYTLRIEAVEVVSTQVLIMGTVFKHVIDDFQDRMPDGNAGPLLARLAAKRRKREARKLSLACPAA